MPGRPLPIIPSSSSSSSTSSSSSVSSPDHPDSDGPASPFHKNNRFRPILDRFDEMTRNAAEIQSDLLRSIIRDNAGCEYLQQFQGIGALSSSEQVVASATGDADYIDGFKKAIPLITHPDIMPFIERIAEHGNEGSPPGGLLTAAPVQGLCLSSGTTDTRAKYLLYHQGLKEGTVEVASIAAAFREGIYPVEPGSRILEFLFCGKFTATKGGLKAGTATTHMIRGGAFRMRQQKSGFRSCSPEDVILAPDCRQSMYCHLLCGLVHAHEVRVLSAPFAFTLVEALRTLETEWRSLCHDIRSGELNEKITDPGLRAAMEDHILCRKPNPVLADSIASKCRGLTSKRALGSGGAWKGAVRILWPRCKYLLSILTGAMEVYVEKLEFYTGGAVPLVSADYAATEGWIGVNIGPTSAPTNVSFTILPTLAFFEFIPLSRAARSAHINDMSNGGGAAAMAAYDEGTPVGLTDVKVGQEYEIVMTTAWGLYRYRLGDIVRVTGFYNNAPQVAYVCRKNVMLSLNIDKITEKDLKAVVDRAAKRLVEVSGSTMELVDYTSYADRTTTPGHYVVFWEVQGGETPEAVPTEVDKCAKSCKKVHAYDGSTSHDEPAIMGAQQVISQEDLLADCAALMDRSFVEAGYVTSRKMGTIGALELCIVQRGTFSRLVDRFMLSGATITQYKMPRCLVSPDALSVLRSSAIAKLFSPTTHA